MHLPAKPRIQGVGLGLRACHYQTIYDTKPDIPWFEILSDNYLDGGIPLNHLDWIRERHPLVMHGVGMSLGSTDPLNVDYLKKLRQLAHHIEPAWISDHLCWISHDSHYFHELLPLPYTEEALCHVVSRIQQVQDFLKQPILIENVSSYLRYPEPEMPEWMFINEVARQAGCFILLDINNIYVSAFNHQFSAQEYLSSINNDRVKQFHLAGYEIKETYLFDAHNQPVHSPVWELYQLAVQRMGRIPTLIEWDNDIPDFSGLLSEAQKAEKIMGNTSNDDT
jgi:uncharacterized protein (UPF0276 family)